MSERYPDDASLLALAADPATGAEYIATDRSPYYLEFRRLVQRMLLAGQRANDLRVYQDGDLTVGVRPGRCVIADAAIDFEGATGLAVTADAVTQLWLDGAGVVQSGAALPADRTGFVPLAQVSTASIAISVILDRRGEAFLHVPGLAALNVTVSADQINQALTGIAASVTAASLNRLTGGPSFTADADHRHLQVWQDANDEVHFHLYNDNAGSAANVGLALSLPNRLLDDLVLLPNPASGFLSQRFDGLTYNLLGTVHAAHSHAGALTSTQSGKLLGPVSVGGAVSGVLLSLGTNLQSSLSSDGIEAQVKVNGTLLTSTHPRITSAAGAGFRSTARGQGTAGVVKTDGAQNVQRGDVLSVDLVRAVGGPVSVEAADAAVLVVIRAAGPE